MGKLIQTFTFDRNTFLRTPELSSDKAVESMRIVQSTKSLDKTTSNKIGALASYMGLFKKDDDNFKATDLARVFLKLYNQDRNDSWRWLITRSFWIYQVPNGTNARVNAEAKSLGIGFSFFRMLVQLLFHLQAHPASERFLYYDELCEVLNDDNNWSLESYELYSKIIAARATLPDPSNKLGLLGELEDQFSIPRDNFNGLLNKSYQQTGFFDYSSGDHGKIVGMALRHDLDQILQDRLRFVVDNATQWDEVQSWSDFLSLRKDDIPQKVSLSRPRVPALVGLININDMATQATSAMNGVGFIVGEELVRRYIASLMAKRFVILSGLSGSGKTKLAQLFAAWMDEKDRKLTDPFAPGTEIHSDRAIYRVKNSTPYLVEFEKTEEGGTKTVPLPRNLIEEWAKTIEKNGFTKEISAEDIRNAVKNNSQYANFMHGFASQLKAAAFRVYERGSSAELMPRYVVTPVEANWTSTEDIFGYADALDPNHYMRKPALEVVLSAEANFRSSDPIRPYFLILDEMNLSHVERYFAAVLSAIESGEQITLHGDETVRDGVPPKIYLPPNLFVIGTINIDETTYMFSPKVLDRANVIEFRVSDYQLNEYLERPEEVDKTAIEGKGSALAETFVRAAMQPLSLKEFSRNLLAEEVNLFSNSLSEHESEFGFRVVKEMSLFLQFHEQLTPAGWNFRDAWDALILQKVLPKLHGSQRKLEPLLRTLIVLCHDWRVWRNSDNEGDKDQMQKSLTKLSKDAADIRSRDLDPINAKIQADKLLISIGDENIKEYIKKKVGGNMTAEIDRFSVDTAYLKLSFEKIARMIRRLQRDGFTSYAEA